MEKERRSYTRFDVPLQVQFKEVKEEVYCYAGTTLNFSRSGICLKTGNGAENLSGALELRVKMPGRDEYVPALGDIVWADHNEEECLLGIRLIAMDREAKFNILDHCGGLHKVNGRTDFSSN